MAVAADAGATNTCHLEACEGLLGAREFEVVGVVVGEREEVEACVDEQVDVVGGHAEGVVVASGVFVAYVIGTADDPFAVARRDVGVAEDVGHVVEEVATVVGWQLRLRIEGSQHHVADEGEGDGGIIGGGSGCRRKEGKAGGGRGEDAASADVAVAVVAFVGGGDGDAAFGGGVDEMEDIVAVDGGDDADMADGFLAAVASAEEDEVAH